MIHKPSGAVEPHSNENHSIPGSMTTLSKNLIRVTKSSTINLSVSYDSVLHFLSSNYFNIVYCFLFFLLNFYGFFIILE